MLYLKSVLIAINVFLFLLTIRSAAERSGSFWGLCIVTTILSGLLVILFM